MDEARKGRLERYFKNSGGFLWDLPRMNQARAYAWLREKGYEFEKGPYKHVSGQLVQKYGIEDILANIIVPRVKELFSEDALNFLRSCWRTGMLPDMSFVTSFNVRDPYPFLEINSQFNYVSKWGEFAGVWFEEIEPGLEGRA